jgi:hypothetical protein
MKKPELFRIGEWVKQYHSGYWIIVDIRPRYAEETMINDNIVQYYKGDEISSWVCLQKALTDKMKFKTYSEIVDICCCKHISSAEEESIISFFQTHKKEYETLLNTPFDSFCRIYEEHLYLNEQDEKRLKEVILKLPKTFTKGTLKTAITKSGLSHIYTFPGNYLLCCKYSFWQDKNDLNTIYKEPKLIKLQSNQIHFFLQ